MRKRIFSRLMAMFMAVALLSTSALAVDVTQEYIDGLRGSGYDQYGNQYVYMATDTYVLKEDIHTEHILRFGDLSGDSSLDLNGFTIDHGGKKGPVIQVGQGAKLTITDSSEEGTGMITGGTGPSTQYETTAGGISVECKAELVLDGGTISGNTGRAAVDIIGGNMTMNGGTISTENNIGIYLTSKREGFSSIHPTLTIEGGEITNNSTGIQVYGDGDITMNGGIISKNSTGVGLGYGGSFTVNGGSISENETGFSTYMGGSVDLTNGVLCANKRNRHSQSGSVQGEENMDVYDSHAEVVDEAVEPTCTQKGLTRGSHCSQCGLVLVAQEKIPATGHTYAPATCTEPETCHCGATRGEALGHDMGEWVVATPARPGVAGEESRTCSRCDYTETQPIEALPVPPVIDVDFPGTDAGTTISDEETPLAGVLTLANLLNALYEYEEVEDSELPEDFKWADHVYAQAICWGLEEGLVEDTEDDPLDPDELLTVALLREVLVNFAGYKGIDLTVTLDGRDEDLVLDLGERLEAFYKELEEALTGKAA